MLPNEYLIHSENDPHQDIIMKFLNSTNKDSQSLKAGTWGDDGDKTQKQNKTAQEMGHLDGPGMAAGTMVIIRGTPT